MINNEKEFLITQKMLERFQSAVANFNVDDVSRKTGSRILAEAELNSLKSQVEDLSIQLNEYESTRGER